MQERTSTVCVWRGLMMAAAAVVVALGGCIATEMHLEGHTLNTTEREQPAIILLVGEARPVATDNPDAYGGDYDYVLGIASEDPSIVSVSYANDNWQTGTSALTARKVGKTRVYYVNAAIFTDPAKPLGAYGEAADYARQHGRYFDVTVVAP